MDIFESDAFSVIELTRALENIPFKPATLSGSGLFADRGVRARTVVIESRDGTLSLIPFSERGFAHDQQVPERRDGKEEEETSQELAEESCHSRSPSSISVIAES